MRRLTALPVLVALVDETPHMVNFIGQALTEEARRG
jgi:hypothetical protein